MPRVAFSMLADGWIQARVRLGLTSVTICASELDALGDLVTGIHALLRGAQTVRVSWPDDQYDYEWTFTASGDEVSVQIRALEPAWSHEPDRGELLLTGVTSNVRWCGAVADGAQRLLDELGAGAYEHERPEGAFPGTALSSIRAVLAGHAPRVLDMAGQDVNLPVPQPDHEETSAEFADSWSAQRCLDEIMAIAPEAELVVARSPDGAGARNLLWGVASEFGMMMSQPSDALPADVRRRIADAMELIAREGGDRWYNAVSIGFLEPFIELAPDAEIDAAVADLPPILRSMAEEDLAYRRQADAEPHFFNRLNDALTELGASHAGRPWLDVATALRERLGTTTLPPETIELFARGISSPHWPIRHPLRYRKLRRFGRFAG